jgi:hypothetical protein
METLKVVAEHPLPGTAGVHLGEFCLDIPAPTHCDLHAGDLGHWRQHDCPLVRLPRPILFALCLLIVAWHNLLDGLQFPGGTLWTSQEVRPAGNRDLPHRHLLGSL